MNFLSNYGLFVLKLTSLVIAILVIVAGIIAIVSKEKAKMQAKLCIKPLNKKFKEYSKILFEGLEDKQKIKNLKKEEKLSSKKNDTTPTRLFVLNFQGDIRASQLNALREEITAILLIATPQDEVLVRLESAGGLVNAYGLAASQLNRFKAANIKLIISIDKIAASGGYLMACVADHIIAAPFAIIGSIGVLAQLPNFHDYLKKKNIAFEQITAGEYKRTLSLFGENTSKGREKMQREVNETHAIFKDHIQHHRPQVSINEVATGEHWLAQKAQEFRLVDALETSDDYLMKNYQKKNIYEIEYKIKKPLPQRLAASAANVWDKWVRVGKFYG